MFNVTRWPKLPKSRLDGARDELSVSGSFRSEPVLSHSKPSPGVALRGGGVTILPGHEPSPSRAAGRAEVRTVHFRQEQWFGLRLKPATQALRQALRVRRECSTRFEQTW